MTHPFSHLLARAHPAAAQRLQQLGWPHPKLEYWQFTDLNSLAEQSFVMQHSAKLQPELAPDHLHFVFVNGALQRELSSLDQLPAGVSVRELQAGEATLPGLEDQPFAALNESLAQGVAIYVAADVKLEPVLHLTSMTTATENGCTLALPRIKLELGANASATWEETHWGEGAYLSCPLTEIIIGDRAELDVIRDQSEAESAWHLGSTRITQGENSQLHFASVQLGSRLGRHDMEIHLLGEEISCNLQGFHVGAGVQVLDHHLRMQHAKPHCNSEQQLRCILGGSARSVFDGLIHVHQDAQKTDAIQQTRNLVLSGKAEAFANPRLEIYADDVRCTHGATFGFLDQTQLLYLRSRGIPLAEAQVMLVQAFATDALAAIRNENLRSQLLEKMQKHLLEAAQTI